MPKELIMKNTVVTKWTLAGAVGLFAITAGFSSSARAEESPCRADAEKFCKGVSPGGGRIIRCMKEHENELSPACKDHIAKKREEIEEVHAACKDDAAKLCKDVPRGRGAIARCLHEHEKDVSSACKDAISKAKAK